MEEIRDGVHKESMVSGRKKRMGKQEFTEEGIQKTARKRLLFFAVLCSLFLLALLGRLIYIQIIDEEKYTSAMERQQRIVIDGVDKRGVIYDRNGEPITGRKEEYIYIFRKNEITNELQQILDSMGATLLNGRNGKHLVYSTKHYCKQATKRLQEEYGAFIMRTDRRYSENQPAVHVIGHINRADSSGVCGIEKDFDAWLLRRDKTLYSVADAGGYLISGMGITESVGRECGVVTTLDLSLQEHGESILKKTGVSGAIVVTEVRTGEILVEASAPTYNPNCIEDYLGSGEREFVNLAAQGQYPPGSVFKLVVAAAALESGAFTTASALFCRGYEKTGTVQVDCATGGRSGHGSLTFSEAFSKSCNSAFIQIGKGVGAEKILEMAKLLGANEKTLTGLGGEKRGMLPEKQDTAGAGIANLSIGQGKLLVTPLQIAKLTQIIANGGVSSGLTLIKSVVDGGKKTEVLGKESRRLLSPETAEDLRLMMVDTVKRGTANNLMGVSAGGKTGSAEAYSAEGEVVHGWFTGFVPAENPRYTITVLVAQGGSGRKSAVPIFEEMAKACLLKAEGGLKQVNQ